MLTATTMPVRTRPPGTGLMKVCSVPGAMMGASGGQREFVPALSRAAVASGASGLFIETHPDPAKAISDAATQLPLSELGALVSDCLEIWQIVNKKNA